MDMKMNRETTGRLELAEDYLDLNQFCWIVHRKLVPAFHREIDCWIRIAGLG